MAIDKKISQLPVGSLDMNSILPVVTNGITTQVTFDTFATGIIPYVNGGPEGPVGPAGPVSPCGPVAPTGP